MIITSYSDLKLALATSLKTIFPNNAVIRSQQNGPEPSNPYVVITVLRATQTGMPHRETLVDQGFSTIRVDYQAVVQFSFISKNEESAGDMANLFMQRVNHPSTREVFRSNGLAYLSGSNLRNVANKRETTWIQSYNVDINFLFSILTSDEAITINTVEITDLLSGEVFTAPTNVIIP
jgi:hypothetical protein